MLWWKVSKLRGGSPEGRRRVAQELAADPDPKVSDALAEVLSDTDRDARRMAAWALLVRADPRGISAMLMHCEDMRRGPGQDIADTAQYVGAAAVGPLTRALGDPYAVARRAAAELLGRLADPQATDALVASLADSDVSVRIWAARSLGKARDHRAAQPLVAALSDSNREVQDSAAASLAELGFGALDAVTACLSSPEISLRQAAGDVLRRMGADFATASLVQALASPYPDVRQLAVLALSDLTLSSCQAALVEALAHPLQDVRTAAATVLREHNYAPGTPEESAAYNTAIGRADWAARAGDHALEPLIMALAQGDTDERVEAARGLARLSQPKAVDAFVEALLDPEAPVRETAAVALSRLGWQPRDPSEQARALAARRQFSEAAALGDDALGPLSVAVQDRAAAVRTEAAQALAAVLGPMATELLIGLAGDTESPVAARLAAVSGLGREGEARAVDALLDALADPSLRPSAVEALGRTRTLEALPALCGCLSDPEPTTRARAAEALGGFADARAVEGLLPLTRDAAERVRAAAVRALGEIGDPAAGAAVEAALDDEHALVRDAAHVALGGLPTAGAVAELLLRAATPANAEAAIEGLRRAVARHAGSIPDADLARLACLPDLEATAFYQHDGSGAIAREANGVADHQKTQTVDCADIRGPALAEMARRGLDPTHERTTPEAGGESH